MDAIGRLALDLELVSEVPLTRVESNDASGHPRRMSGSGHRLPNAVGTGRATGVVSGPVLP